MMLERRYMKYDYVRIKRSDYRELAFKDRKGKDIFGYICSHFFEKRKFFKLRGWNLLYDDEVNKNYSIMDNLCK